MIESITPLIEVKTIGFLVYDEVRRKLQARAPFVGIPTDFVGLYAVTIPRAARRRRSGSRSR